MYAHEVSHVPTLMLTTQRMHAGLMILMILEVQQSGEAPSSHLTKLLNY